MLGRSALWSPLGGWLAPPLCWACASRAERSQPLCARCRLRLRRPGAGRGGGLSEPVVLSGLAVWAPVAYEGPARDLVRALKFRGATGVADFMAVQIVANAPAGLLEGTLVPVPLHPRRLRSRGYNQATAIAAALATRTALATRAALRVEDCLARAGPAVTQVGRARAERQLGPAGRIVAEWAPRGRVLLVDDVVTTGATLRACAAALHAAGCPDVAAVVFARTLGR